MTTTNTEPTTLGNAPGELVARQVEAGKKLTRRERREARRRARYEAEAAELDALAAGAVPTTRKERRVLRQLARLVSHWTYRQLRTRRARKAAETLGWHTTVDLEGMASTSQVGALNVALTRTDPPIYGPPLGVDHFTGQTITHNLWGLYDAGVITSPNVVVIGKVGSTKSTLAKTAYGLRLLNTRGNRLVVFDRKEQRDGATIGGEYTRLACLVDSERIPLNRDPRLGARVNILDPRISAHTGDGETSTIGQDHLLGMVARAALGRPLNGYETHALASAHRAALAQARAQGRVAVLPDVIDALFVPTSDQVPGPRNSDGVPVLEARGLVTEDRVVEWGLELALALSRYLQGDLSGLIDGETRGPGGTDLTLDAALTIIDTSALPQGSDALAIMMAVFATYLMSYWAHVDGHKTLILEEAYSASNLGAVGEIFRGLVKRSRGIGASVVSIFHHLHDVPDDSPLMSVIREADVAHIFTQDKTADAEALVAMFGLPDPMVEVIQTLPKGVHVLTRGNLPPTIVHGFWTPVEQWVTYTNNAMEVS